MILPNQELLALELHLARQERIKKTEMVRFLIGRQPKQPGTVARGLYWLGYQMEILGVKLQQKQHSLANATIDQ